MTDKTDDKIEELKSATRAANEALAEIKQVLKDVRAAQAEVSRQITKAFDDEVSAMVATKLAQYEESMNKAIEDGTNAALARFDQLTAVMLGETKDQKRKHEKTIPEIIEDAAAVKHAPPPEVPPLPDPLKKGYW